jgi:hypothetical protein
MADIPVGSQLVVIAAPNPLTISSIEYPFRTQAPSKYLSPWLQRASHLCFSFLKEIYSQKNGKVVVGGGVTSRLK